MLSGFFTAIHFNLVGILEEYTQELNSCGFKTQFFQHVFLGQIGEVCFVLIWSKKKNLSAGGKLKNK